MSEIPANLSDLIDFARYPVHAPDGSGAALAAACRRELLATGSCLLEGFLTADGVERVARESATLPAGSLHLHCTDTHGEWLVSTEGGYHLVRAHEKGAAALRGPAEALLLRLWNRDTDRAGELSPVGDESVLESWLTLSQSR